MRLAFCIFICAIEICYQQCYGLGFIDLPGFGSDEKESKLKSEGDASASVFNENTGGSSVANSTWSNKHNQSKISQTSQSIATIWPYPPVRSTKVLASSSTLGDSRRYWLVSASSPKYEASTVNSYRDDKDENIKSKIGMLVQQTMHDTEVRMKSVLKLKEKHRDEPTYRVGFILSMIKKSRDVLNELFNVAVKHRDEWKALEQLKIFELIVHTNVDATNLVRQLVEIHIQNLNATAMSNKEKEKEKQREKEREAAEKAAAEQQKQQQGQPPEGETTTAAGEKKALRAKNPNMRANLRLPQREFPHRFNKVMLI